jgi:hypothetical protein
MVEFILVPVTVDYDHDGGCMRICKYRNARKELFGYLEALDVFPGLFLDCRE